jgi:hypothetical protein
MASYAVAKVPVHTLAVVLLVVAAARVTVGIVYFTRTAADLPAFFRGHAAHSTITPSTPLP